MRAPLIILIAGLVSACAGERARVDNDKCLSYGAVPGTAPYVHCRTALDAARTQSSATMRAAPVYQPDFVPRPQ
jgi:hypothetical protein